MNPLDSIRIVLYRPENPSNVGAVVRAMRNMGISRLRLVEPAPYTRDDLLRVAHRCEDLVDRIEVYSSLESALADTTYVVGTAAMEHADYRLTRDVRSLAVELVRRAATEPVALLFGAESDGLDRYALDRCHLIASLPADPRYPALNLAQSVLLFVYELSMAAAESSAPPEELSHSPATQEHLERLFGVGEDALRSIGFFKYNPDAVMHTIRQIVYRAAPTPEEVALLLAIARQVQRSGRSEHAPTESGS